MLASYFLEVTQDFEILSPIIFAQSEEEAIQQGNIRFPNNRGIKIIKIEEAKLNL